ncbi:hypothetical protein EVAR_52978_1 [Eumeta japonica]|uniref:Uncharacterized protein n=1 Tax=Eumeta variegata TaxID=151549 RepID=A0A4C1Z3L1_EUMVA|nr:hypothetical protein EVAR_52978_1 [Eumeta japonica]
MIFDEPLQGYVSAMYVALLDEETIAECRGRRRSWRSSHKARRYGAQPPEHRKSTVTAPLSWIAQENEPTTTRFEGNSFNHRATAALLCLPHRSNTDRELLTLTAERDLDARIE